MKLHLTFATTLLLAIATIASASDTPKSTDSATAFAHIKSLAGEWQGTNGRGGKTHVHYEVVSGGSAVMERFEDASMGASNAMVTMYYLDGGRLVLTHYCMAKNQPRMQADVFDSSTGELHFAFLDAAGLPNAAAGHMHNATFHFVDSDHFSTAWEFFQDGKSKMTETSQYTRVQ